jgi:hypothetical protein
VRKPSQGGRLALLLVLTTAWLACGSSDNATGSGGGLPEAVPGDASIGDAVERDTDLDVHVCNDDASVECTIDLGTHNGVHDCAKGSQTCKNGKWSACIAAPIINH